MGPRGIQCKQGGAGLAHSLLSQSRPSSGSPRLSCPSFSVGAHHPQQLPLLRRGQTVACPGIIRLEKGDSRSPFGGSIPTPSFLSKCIFSSSFPSSSSFSFLPFQLGKEELAIPKYPTGRQTWSCSPGSSEHPKNRLESIHYYIICM